MKHELYDKLTQLQWVLHKQQVRMWATNGPLADTSRGQGRILAMLKIKDGISTKDLAFLLGMRVSSLNEMLSKMEKNGFVTRIASEEDKRVMLVHLTDLGRDHEQAKPEDMSSIFDCLTEAEQALFGEYLDRILGKVVESEEFSKEDIAKKMESLKARFGEFGSQMGRKAGFPGGFNQFFSGHHAEGDCDCGCGCTDEDVVDVEVEVEEVVADCNTEE